MTVICSSRLARAAAAPTVLLALTAGLAGCRGGAVAAADGSPATPATASSAPAAGATAAGATASSAPAASAPAGTPAQEDGTTAGATAGPGSVTASLTAPVAASGTARVPVSCVTGVGYHAAVTSAVVPGGQLSYTVGIPRYTGPGSYYAVVTATFRQASGVVTAVGGVSRVPAVITAAGGSLTVSATGSGGRTFAGSLSWTCGA